ncbi:MAG: hypothetical protein J0L73_07255 [Verrucomicrobia bacterium]|nr:hypothetical protein [Verrucomicrobiota bacterium]
MTHLASFFPPTTTRVESNTCAAVNKAIHEAMVQRIGRIAAGGPAAIDRRLQELNHEWDIERSLETGAASLSLTTLTLAATVDRRWAGVTAAVAAFLLLHALQGWCPPLVVFRRLGVRTAHEINVERLALRLLRDDFRVETRAPAAAVSIADSGSPTAAL